MPVEPVASATVVVLRESPAGPEVLMVRRHERSDDFAGVSVFPGGLVEPADGDPALVPADAGFSAAAAIARLGESLGEGDARSLYVAACRELFEEAGLLLASPLSTAALARLSQRRIDLQAARSTLRAILESEGCRLALDQLLPFARWITPEFQPRRWDTRFFLAAAPSNQAAQCDGTETSEAAWLRPADALEAYRRGEHILAPPTFRVLEDLSGFTTVEQATEALRQAGPPRPVLPVPLANAPRPTMVYPGDREYPNAAGTALNRLVLHEKRWKSERSEG